MTALFGAEHANLLATIETGAKARHAKAVASERDGEHAREFEDLFSEQLLAAYTRLTPPEKLRERLYKRFRDFQMWVGAIAMPYHGSTAGLYILHLTTMEHKSLSEVKAAADAIRFVHEQAGFHIDPAYIEAALAVAAELASGGDDGGGETADNPPPPPADYGALPLAAGA